MHMRFLVVLAALAWAGGCTFIEERDEVDISIFPNSPTGVVTTTPTPVGGSIELVPNGGQVAVGKNLNVTVIVRDANGGEVSPENLTIAIADTSVVRLVQIDARTLLLEGLKVGSTEVIVSASGLQASMIVQVIP